jgi:hypothetical protein
MLITTLFSVDVSRAIQYKVLAALIFEVAAKYKIQTAKSDRSNCGLSKVVCSDGGRRATKKDAIAELERRLFCTEKR